MTATERLRELLDERGVEWWPAKYYKDENTVYRANGMEWRASEQTDGKLLIGCTSLAHLTPEQAIADTLGAGTCHDAGGKYSWGNWTCSECGFVMPSHFKLDELGGPLYRFCPNCGRKVVDA